MTDDDPIPLKAGGEAAPELMRALLALRSVRVDAPRRARISERLADRTSLEPPPARSSDDASMFVPALAIAFVVLCALAYLLVR